jgi:hypothetical protein
VGESEEKLPEGIYRGRCKDSIKIYLREGHAIQSGRSRVRVAMRWIFFFNLTNPSSRTLALGSTQLLTELSTRNLPRGDGWPVHKAENLIAIGELIV